MHHDRVGHRSLHRIGHQLERVIAETVEYGRFAHVPTAQNGDFVLILDELRLTEDDRSRARVEIDPIDSITAANRHFRHFR